MIQARPDRVRELAGIRLSGSRQHAMRYFEHFGRGFGHLGITGKPRRAPQISFCGWRGRPIARPGFLHASAPGGGTA
jgi:hypothetical protein